MKELATITRVFFLVGVTDIFLSGIGMKYAINIYEDQVHEL